MEPVTHALGWDLRADVRQGMCDVCYGTLELSGDLFVVIVAWYAVEEGYLWLHCRHPTRLMLTSVTHSSLRTTVTARTAAGGDLEADQATSCALMCFKQRRSVWEIMLYS